MLTASLFARNSQHLVDWVIPDFKNGENVPHILRWPINDVPGFRFFVMNTGSLKVSQATLGTNATAEYLECDAPLTIGRL